MVIYFDIGILLHVLTLIAIVVLTLERFSNVNVHQS